MTRVLAGDETASRELTERMVILPAFLRSRNRKLGSPLTAEELEDLAQDALVIAWRRLSSFTGRAALETWVCSIGCYEMMNALRRKARRRAREHGLEDQVDRVAEEPPLEFGDPEGLDLALAELPPQDAELLHLKHGEGLSFSALGERLGLSTSGVKRRYYRVLEQLRRRLQAGERGGQR